MSDSSKNNNTFQDSPKTFQDLELFSVFRRWHVEWRVSNLLETYPLVTAMAEKLNKPKSPHSWVPSFEVKCFHHNTQNNETSPLPYIFRFDACHACSEI